MKAKSISTKLSLAAAAVSVITLVVFLLVALGAYFLSVSPVLFVVLSAVIGIAVKNWGVRK